MARMRSRLLAPAVAVLLLAGCGDGEAGEVGTPRAEGGGASDAASIEADIRASYEASMSATGDEAVDANLALLTARCREAWGLDDLTPTERSELATAIEADDAEVVDVTSRFRTDTTAQVELIGALEDGTYRGALDWVDVTYEDGHWRIDDCDSAVKFSRVGQALGEDAPTLPEPTAEDELAIARAIEAMYLGRGSADDAWASLSERCRSVDWADSFDDFAGAFAAVAADRAADPVDFQVVEATVQVWGSSSSDVEVVVERDGARMELDRSLAYTLEGDRWVDDTCEDPADEDDGLSAEQEFEAVGEQIN
jgi:hypothetical protein